MVMIWRCHRKFKPFISRNWSVYKLYYKHALKNLSMDNYKSKPPDCTCESSPFKYSPSGQVITSDLNIVENISLRNVFTKGPKSVSLNP